MAARRSKVYSLRLELRDDTDAIVGRLSAKVSANVISEFVQSASVDTEQTDHRQERPRPDVEQRRRGERLGVGEKTRSPSRAMSKEQRRLFFRLAYNLGYEKDDVTNKVLDALGVERFEWATREVASEAIDILKHEAAIARNRSNGAAHG